MRIGIDGACWLNRRGYGRFTRELLAALVPLDPHVEYTLLVDFDPADAPPVPAGVRVLRVPTRHPAARSAAASGRRTLGDLWTASRAISRAGFDLVFFPSAYTYVPVSGRARVAVVIHDVIAETFRREVFPTRRAALFWDLKMLAARRRADLVMTVSEASRRGIAERFGIPAARIAVLTEAADPCFRPLPSDAARRAVLTRYGLSDRRFVLYVGGISPHKNLGALLAAFAATRGEPGVGDHRLVLAGDFERDVFYSAYEDLRGQIASLGLAGAVDFTGYVDDADLAHLYNAADAFVLPSLWEGFGLPAIEAMACGTPVLASARGSLPEIVGSAGVLFDPDRPLELATALRRVLGDDALRARLRRQGPRRAAEFSWTRAAELTLAAFRQLLARPPVGVSPPRAACPAPTEVRVAEEARS